jgi:hypothetical protein
MSSTSLSTLPLASSPPPPSACSAAAALFTIRKSSSREQLQSLLSREARPCEQPGGPALDLDSTPRLLPLSGDAPGDAPGSLDLLSARGPSETRPNPLKPVPSTDSMSSALLFAHPGVSSSCGPGAAGAGGANVGGAYANVGSFEAMEGHLQQIYRAAGKGGEEVDTNP